MKTRDCRFARQEPIGGRRRDPAERVRDFDPVEPPLTEAEAIAEARRCLATVACEACEVCILICPDLCISRDPDSGRIVIDLDHCKGCGLCAHFCPREAIRMEEERE